MIGTALSYIRKRLDAHLRAVQGQDDDGSAPERVVFVEGDKLEPLSIPQGSIGMLVANVWEDREFREADRYQRRVVNSHADRMERHHPDIHLEFTILFIANFKDYDNAWNQLSQLLFFFQAHPVFAAEQDRDLPRGIGRLANELCSQSLQQQNELWSALKAPLRPSILIRFRLISLWGQAIEEQPLPVQTVETRLNPQKIPANRRSPPLRDPSPPP